MLHLPPLESLRFFEAAARHQSFSLAGGELGVTAAAVAHRIRTLEKHLDAPLFERRQRGVRLNLRGQAYLKEVQRILAEVHGVSEQHRREPRRVRIVSVEAVAEKWLMPRLPSFKASYPGIAIELETNHRGVNPDRNEFDAWLAYTGETAARRPVTRREDTLMEETLYEEELLPVCSPALLTARGRPRDPADLAGWPLLYDLGWNADWAYWFARQGQPTPRPRAGLRLPPLQHARQRGSERHRGRDWAPDADRPRAGEENPGPHLRPPGRGARTLLPHHDSRLAAAARSPGVPGMDPAGGREREPVRRGRFPAWPVTRRRSPVSAPAPRTSPRARCPFRKLHPVDLT